AVIKIAFACVNNKAQRVAAITAVRKSAAVLCRCTFYPEITEIPATTGVHRMCVIDAFLKKPLMNFPTPDHFGARGIGNRGAVTNVIHVAVRLQDIVCLNISNVNIFRQFIWSNERVKQKLFVVDLDQETGMTIISKLHSYF